MIGYILRWTNANWDVTFYVSAAVYFLGVFCWMGLDPVTPIEEHKQGRLETFARRRFGRKEA